jgi:hypothetical protein
MPLRATRYLAGIITTVCGSGGMAGWGGDGSPCSLAHLNAPGAVATDGNVAVYFFDSLNFRLRRFDRVSGLVSHVAGTGVGIGSAGAPLAPDGSPAASTMLPASLYALAVRPSDHAVVYIGWYTYSIRSITSPAAVDEASGGPQVPPYPHPHPPRRVSTDRGAMVESRRPHLACAGLHHWHGCGHRRARG